MSKTQLLFVGSIITLFTLSGCVQNDIERPQQHYGYNQQQQQQQSEKSWGEQTNLDEESIDISDLDENITESETAITETQEPQKMARIPFPVSEYNRLARTGKATISGTIYVNDNYGKKNSRFRNKIIFKSSYILFKSVVS